MQEVKVGHELACNGKSCVFQSLARLGCGIEPEQRNIGMVQEEIIDCWNAAEHALRASVRQDASHPSQRADKPGERASCKRIETNVGEPVGLENAPQFIQCFLRVGGVMCNAAADHKVESGVVI